MKIENLTREGFAPFGDVIERDGAELININQNFAQRFNDLAYIDVQTEGGSVNISLAAAKPRPQPIAITMMERHPLGSQIFHPLQNMPWLVLVCAEPTDIESFRAFRASGEQGINYARGTWHHPLLVLQPQQFFIVDRKGPGVNLEEVTLGKAITIYSSQR